MLYRISLSLLVAAVLAVCHTGCTPESGPKSTTNVDVGIVLPDSITFWQHVAPIVAHRCAPCHHEGGAGPFALLRYEDFEKRMQTVQLAVADGYMPPWPADPEYRSFKDEKCLTAYEKALILAWIAKGSAAGDAPPSGSVAYTPPKWQQPDWVVRFRDTVKLGGSGLDRFFMAKVPFELPFDTVVAAIAFVPGHRQLVHHVNGHLINYQPGMKKDIYAGSWLEDAEVRSSLAAYADMRLAHDDGTYPPMRVSAFNYLPGTEPLMYPNGLGGIHISRKGAFLLNTLHYGPSPVDTFDTSEIHLYFAERAPERPLLELHLGTQGETPVVPAFVIPADSIVSFSTRYTVKEAISVLTVNPHMHLLGKSFKAYAAGGSDTIPLIYIPEWDFRWQYFYTFRQMVKVPAGYTIVAEATFDNTMHNPFNPNKPPKTLKAAGRNMKTTDEMFQFFVNFLPYREGDENVEL